MELFYLSYYSVLGTLVCGLLYVRESQLEARRYIAARLLSLIALLLFSLDSYFRGNRGTDTLAYRQHFEWVRVSVDGFYLPPSIYEFELGYNLLAILAVKLHLEFEHLQFLLAAASFLLILKISRLVGCRASLLTLLIILSGYLAFSYNGTRQWIALLMLYLALASIHNRYLLQTIIAAPLSLLFHRTAIIPMLFGGAFLIRQRRLTIAQAISAAALLTVCVALLVAMTNIVDVHTYYSSSLGDALAPSQRLGYGWVVQTLMNLLALYIIYQRRRNITFLEILSLAWIVLYTVFAYNQLVMRLALYFGFAQLLLVSQYAERAERNSTRVLSGYIALCTISFVAQILSNSGNIAGSP